MCELLGLCFNEPVRPTLSFRGFRKRAEQNPDGWGLAWYSSAGATVIKEPARADRSRLAEHAVHQVESPIIIGHVREASRGGSTLLNTHPFRRDREGQAWTFAHNGTIAGHQHLPIGAWSPDGETDSEQIFCHLLYLFDQRGGRPRSTDDFAWLASELRRINQRGTMSLLFSEGEHLFCYRDASGEKALSRVRRQSPHAPLRLVDEDWEVELEVEKTRPQAGYVVATTPLTRESWQSLDPGALLVLRAGESIYQAG